MFLFFSLKRRNDLLLSQMKNDHLLSEPPAALKEGTNSSRSSWYHFPTIPFLVGLNAKSFGTGKRILVSSLWPPVLPQNSTESPEFILLKREVSPKVQF